MQPSVVPDVTFAVSWIAGAVLALIGVDYYALVWSFAGALVSMMITPAESRRAMLYQVLACTLIGAALAAPMAGRIGGTRTDLIAAALVFGAGGKLLLSAIVYAIKARIDRAGGQAAGPADPGAAGAAAPPAGPSGGGAQ